MDISTLIHSKDFKKTLDPFQKRFNCPSCGNTKYKLYVHLKRRVYICHRCGIKGRFNKDILPLLDEFSTKIGDFKDGKQKESKSNHLQLPEGFISPIRECHGIPYVYLRERGLSKSEITKYKLGYCTEGIYRGRIIMPLFRDSGELMYFIARTYTGQEPKYLNVGAGRKEVIFKTFTGTVDFAVLVEGIFDAISIGRQYPAIALLGKVCSETQAKKVAECAKRVYVMLDKDAKKQNFQVSCQLGYFLKTKPIFINKKDPGEMTLDEIKEVVDGR